MTFNSPGLPATVGNQAITSLTSQAKIKNIRHYISDGDVVSMAGDYYLANVKDASYTLFSNTNLCWSSPVDYGLDQQHTKTLFFLDHLEGKPDRDPNLTIVSIENPNSLSRGDFSYLTVHSDINIPMFNYKLQPILEAVSDPKGGYWLFNKQYAKMIDILTFTNKKWGDTLVTRAGTENNRIDFFSTVKKKIKTLSGYGNLVGLSTVKVGSEELITTKGSVVHSLSYNFFSNFVFAFFDFTNQEFIWAHEWGTESNIYSQNDNKIMIKKTVSSPYDCKHFCIAVPWYSGNSRYQLTEIVSGNNRIHSLSDVYRSDGVDWLFVDNPNAWTETDYYFTFTVNSSVTRERAIVEGSQQSIGKDTKEIDLFISDIDAVGDAPATRIRASGTKTISALVKTASNPDGITVNLQETELEGLFCGTLSVSALNLMDDDDRLTIVYEDADNGTGAAETIEKVIDIIHDDFENVVSTPENLTEPSDTASWDPNGAIQYVVEYSKDNFEHAVQVVTDGNSVDSFELPAGTYQWRVKADGGENWATGESIVVSEAENESAAPKAVRSNDDGNDDLFFATANGTWESIYYAQHVGSVNDWTGTNEIISASGKGRIQNLFFGSSDPNVLCLTDGENGDAIFVDDVYTDLPEEIEEHTARLYRIQEIRAGAGDDIVDMTSQRFEYVGSGMIIRGGDGDDVIWANKGGNFLSGDAGNDRIVGASSDDLIVGGIGNDRIHGGGGDDVFTFCENWGLDTVEQLATGSVTLWFASGDESKWNAETLTYTDGNNSVKVTGVSEVTLKFGDDGSERYATLARAGAFFDATSERIFEESGKGVLASL